jgi:S1-C subfamily serine protease
MFPDGSQERVDAETNLVSINEAYLTLRNLFSENTSEVGHTHPLRENRAQPGRSVSLNGALGKIILSIAITLMFIILAVTSFIAINNFNKDENVSAVSNERQKPDKSSADMREEAKIPLKISDIAPRLLASTVMIMIEDTRGDSGNGSGFFVNDKGDILTNYHVIEGASDITIVTQDENSYQAKVRAYDAARDIALIASNVPPAECVPLRISDNIPAPGTEILVAGAPIGLSQTLSNGIVSAVRETGDSTVIQITAPISPGSSGGPVVNMYGEVIGISTAYLRGGQNLNFALSSTHIASFVSFAVNMPLR